MDSYLTERRDRVAKALALNGDVLLIAGRAHRHPGGADQCTVPRPPE